MDQLQSTLSWADEKYDTVDHAVRPVEPVDGSKTTDWYGRVARLTLKAGRKRPQCPMHRSHFSKQRHASGKLRLVASMRKLIGASLNGCSSAFDQYTFHGMGHTAR